MYHLLMFLFDYLPPWAVFLLIAVFLVLIMYLFFKLLPFVFPNLPSATGSSDQVGISTTLIVIIGAFYSILFGLINVTLWEKFNRIYDMLSQEASDMSIILLNSEAFPATVRDQLKQGVKTYVIAVRDDEWNKMGSFQSSDQAWKAIWNLYAILQSYKPIPLTYEGFYYASTLAKLDDALNTRRERLDILRHKMPLPMDYAVLLGSILLILFNTLITIMAGKSRHLMFMNITVNCIIVFNLYLMLELHNPFSGTVYLPDEMFTSGMLAQFNNSH